ncbi:hypothetical protein H4R34_001534 [Dimargaris verticillata]|uniref:Uncharacterized protein n=1 Tax=Dimargaris verticillata TaxID=2761393 RepID=A0A9W8B9S3_9FUNG|nr:hypothetical protein H4R34_001534 [Dimargaris verticillata]
MASSPPPPSTMGAWTPSSAEAGYFARLFRTVDTDNAGHIMGHQAVPFFTRSGLPPTVLGEIWELADTQHNGRLDPTAFSIAMKLIALAQNGEQATLANLPKPTGLPTFSGIAMDSSGATETSPARSASPMPALGVTSGEVLSDKERAKYTRLFHNCQPRDGLLDGDKARQVFMKSKLPVETLGRVWDLADTRRRGTLDLADFMIAMYYVQRMMEGRTSTPPSHVPPSLLASARASLPGPTLNQARSTFSPDLSQFEALGHARSNTPSGLSSPPSVQDALPLSIWAISPEEKTQSDRFFATLDPKKEGQVSGEDAVPFFLKSKLPETDLARVWDLADHHKRGRLNQEEFAVALHLIREKLAGKPIPSALPDSLLPPSYRAPTATHVKSPSSKALASGSRPLSPINLLDAFQPLNTPARSESPLQSHSSMHRARSPAALTTTTSLAFDPLKEGYHRPVSVANNTVRSRPSVGQLAQSASPVISAGPTSVGQLAGLQATLAQKHGAVSDLLSQRASLESTNGSLQAQVNELSTQVSQVQARIDQEESLIRTLESDIAQNQQASAQMQRDLAEAEVKQAELSKQKQAKQAELAQAQTQTSSFQQRLQGLLAEVQRAQQDIDRYTQQIQLDHQRAEIGNRQLIQIQAERDQLQRQLHEMREAAQARHVEAHALAERTAQVRQEVQQLGEAIAQAHEDPSLPTPSPALHPPGSTAHPETDQPPLSRATTPEVSATKPAPDFTAAQEDLQAPRAAAAPEPDTFPQAAELQPLAASTAQATATDSSHPPPWATTPEPDLQNSDQPTATTFPGATSDSQSESPFADALTTPPEGAFAAAFEDHFDPTDAWPKDLPKTETPPFATTATPMTTAPLSSSHPPVLPVSTARDSTPVPPVTTTTEAPTADQPQISQSESAASKDDFDALFADMPIASDGQAEDQALARAPETQSPQCRAQSPESTPSGDEEFTVTLDPTFDEPPALTSNATAVTSAPTTDQPPSTGFSADFDAAFGLSASAGPSPPASVPKVTVAPLDSAEPSAQTITGDIKDFEARFPDMSDLDPFSRLARSSTLHSISNGRRGSETLSPRLPQELDVKPTAKDDLAFLFSGPSPSKQSDHVPLTSQAHSSPSSPRPSGKPKKATFDEANLDSLSRETEAYSQPIPRTRGRLAGKGQQGSDGLPTRPMSEHPTSPKKSRFAPSRLNVFAKNRLSFAPFMKSSKHGGSLGKVGGSKPTEPSSPRSNAGLASRPKSVAVSSSSFAITPEDFESAHLSPYPRSTGLPQQPAATKPTPGSDRPTAEDAPDSAEVKMLVGMGFPRDRVIEALEVNDFDIQRATDYLLSY